MKNILRKLVLFSLTGFCFVNISATEQPVNDKESTASTPLSAALEDDSPKQEGIFDAKIPPLYKSHFTWGADVGASIDLAGENMSTIDIDAYFGYKGSWVRTAALGAGIHKAFGNQYTFVPVYALLRTSFRSKPSLLFFELKAGYSFNTLADSGSVGGAYGSVGVGINLAMTKTLQSHLVLSYGFFTLRHATDLNIPYEGDNINSAVLKFGVNF